MVREQLIPPSEHPILTWFRNWPHHTPFLSKWLFILSTTFFLSCTIFNLSIPAYFGNTTIQTILHYQVYRIFLSWMIYTSIWDCILMFLILSFLGARLEKGMGSLQFFWMVMIIGVGTNVLFNGVMLILAYNPVDGEVGYLHLSCVGFWVLCYGFLMFQCLQQPELPVPLLCCPVLVPNKYVPWIIVLLISVFLGFQYAALCGVAVGYLYGRGMLHWMIPSPTTIQRWENGRLRWLTRQKGYVENWCCIGFQELALFDASPQPNYMAPSQHQPPPNYHTFSNIATAPPSRDPFAMAQAPSTNPNQIPAAIPTASSNFPGSGVSSGTTTGVLHAQRMDRQTVRDTLAAAAEARIPPPAEGIPGLQLQPKN